MPVRVVFECSGCDAKADGTRHLRRGVRSMRTLLLRIGVEDVVPDGWIAFDPYTGACYCGKCWDEIVGGIPATREEQPCPDSE